jgi:superfamily II DNA/RNA helicase
MSFADLGLSDELLRAVEESGYTEPTPIQRQAIPSVLMMRDIIGIAQTGTGKTAGFVLPMIDILAQGRSRARMPRSLILEPTRELAAQVSENFEKYGKHHKLSMALLIGGVSMGDQQKALEKGVDVLIATPGRLMDLFGRGKIMLNDCNLLVIDEADRMLDMGFIPDIEEICSKLPSQRQTLLFSATMPGPIKKLADKFLSNPKTIEVARPATANASIDQRLLKVDARKKKQVLIDRLLGHDVRSALVFSNRKTTVRDLAKDLKRAGIRAGEIHGDMEQPERIRELDRFKAGEINILVASDVAARGLDIKDVSHVFNYDVPWHPDDYIHRIGRTGRAGKTGIAITLATPADAEAVEAIEKLTGAKIRPVEAMGAAPAAEPEAAAEEEEPSYAREERPRRERSRGGRSRGGSRSERTEAKEPEAEGPASEQPKRAPRARREEPPRREEQPRREEPPRRASAPSRSHAEPQPAEDDEEGWNGPIPGFLGQSFGT